MNLDKILDNEYWFFLEDNKDVSYYSLSIGLDEYFSTYNAVYLLLDSYHKGKRDEINFDTKESSSYIRCYLNIAIHIQHFFELETKRILEKEHILYAVDDKGDPIILSKLINNQALDGESLKKLKSVEFSEAISRLKKLVDNNTINDEVADLFCSNYKLLQALNQLRNTIIHRGKRVMNYCDLDDFFATLLLPFVKEVLECEYYKSILAEYKVCGYYEAICNIINVGRTTPVDYSSLAYAKELARCKKSLTSRNVDKESEDKEFVEKIAQKRQKHYLEEEYVEGEKCPCCGNYSMFYGREIMDCDIDELGDEMSNVGGFQIIHIPEYAFYKTCVLCDFSYTSFIDV